MRDVLGEPVLGKRAWTRADLDADDGWNLVLGATEIDELEKCARSLPDDLSVWVQMSRDDVQAPQLSAKLQCASNEIEDGFGFAKISGLDISAYDLDMLHRTYWIIAVLLGNVITQNAKGELIGYVTDKIAGAPRGDNDRGYTSSDELRFHCDGGEVSALFCVRQAPTGGVNSIVSLLSVYNDILEKHPEHLESLYRGFPIYMRKEGNDTRLGKVQERRIPSISEKDGRITAWVNLKLAELASSLSDSPFSDSDMAALRIIEEVAEQDTLKFDFRLGPGELMIVNNLSLMHKRSAFQDDPDPAKKRLLLRLWLNLYSRPEVHPIVAGVMKGFGNTEPIITAA
ncbi:TauD/TfdA family dioxygenase [Parvibaculaceae bacterium PLY_AMNH_Bact1]|nr:TauD/TfdA family dioxygenase [Parvibaculaceae bacterium PLY_AMNH_Bact1]